MPFGLGAFYEPHINRLEREAAMRSGRAGAAPPINFTHRDPGASARRVVAAILQPAGSCPGTVEHAYELYLNKLSKEPKGEERDALINKLVAFHQEIEAHLTTQKEHRLEDLKTEHAQVYVKCREALDDFRRFREEHHRLENKMHSIEEQMSGRRGRLNEALGSRMSEAEYPLAHEVQEYERRVKEAREALREPEKAQSDLLGEINAKAAEMREALDRLKKLRTEQESLRAQIEGRPTPGPFGLQQPPED